MIRPRVCKHCSVNNPDANETCLVCQHPLDGTPGLFLHEELLLFALDDETGKISGNSGFAWKYAVAGGLLTELLLAEHLHLDEQGKEPVVNVVHGPSARFHDDLSAEVYETIRARERPRKLSEWVSQVAGLKKLHERIAEPLCAQGILEDRQTEYGFLFFRFTTQRYPLLDPTPEYAAINRVRHALNDHEVHPDERTALLIALANAGKLLSTRFSKQDLKDNKERIEHIAEQFEIGQAVQRTIAAIEAAVIAATTAAAVAAAAGS